MSLGLVLPNAIAALQSAVPIALDNLGSGLQQALQASVSCLALSLTGALPTAVLFLLSLIALLVGLPGVASIIALIPIFIGALNLITGIISGVSNL